MQLLSNTLLNYFNDFNSLILFVEAPLNLSSCSLCVYSFSVSFVHFPSAIIFILISILYMPISLEKAVSKLPAIHTAKCVLEYSIPLEQIFLKLSLELCSTSPFDSAEALFLTIFEFSPEVYAKRILLLNSPMQFVLVPLANISLAFIIQKNSDTLSFTFGIEVASVGALDATDCYRMFVDIF